MTSGIIPAHPAPDGRPYYCTQCDPPCGRPPVALLGAVDGVWLGGDAACAESLDRETGCPECRWPFWLHQDDQGCQVPYDLGWTCENPSEPPPPAIRPDEPC